MYQRLKDFFVPHLKEYFSQALVAHTCDPSYSGGKDQEDQFEASLGKQFVRPYLENAKQG
jgi:hypothetical protein